MGMGRRKEGRQQELWIATGSLPQTPHHVFYEKLNKLLAEARFDEFVEKLCQPHYAQNAGRDSIPPGIYFRMLFVGYFEGIDSQRGIAWRCADSRSIARFLGYAENEETPDHSSLTRIRDRLPEEVHDQVFPFVLQVAEAHRLLKGKTIAVDSTTLEANAAMKSIVRRDTGEDWREYVRRLAEAQGAPSETDEDLRRFDKHRPDKKVSNDEWASSTDTESRIAKMKDGRTHLAYKAEHAIDLESDLLLSAEVYHADEADTQTLLPSVTAAQENLDEAGAERDIEEVVADKGYHAADTLAQCHEWGVLGLRTYIPEPKRRSRWDWVKRPWEEMVAVCANRRRVRGARSKRLQRKRSEFIERSFAHMCDTGGARRTWLRGLEKIRKRYSIHAAARNLGVVMRKLFGFGKPRTLQPECGLFCLVQIAALNAVTTLSAIQREIRSRRSGEFGPRPVVTAA